MYHRLTAEFVADLRRFNRTEVSSRTKSLFTVQRLLFVYPFSNNKKRAFAERTSITYWHFFVWESGKQFSVHTHTHTHITISSRSNESRKTNRGFRKCIVFRYWTRGNASHYLKIHCTEKDFAKNTTEFRFSANLMNFIKSALITSLLLKNDSLSSKDPWRRRRYERIL